MDRPKPDRLRRLIAATMGASAGTVARDLGAPSGARSEREAAPDGADEAPAVSHRGLLAGARLWSGVTHARQWTASPPAGVEGARTSMRGQSLKISSPSSENDREALSVTILWCSGVGP